MAFDKAKTKCSIRNIRNYRNVVVYSKLLTESHLMYVNILFITLILQNLCNFEK